MKKGFVWVLVIILCCTATAMSEEGILPGLDELYGVPLPSVYGALSRYPDIQRVLDDDSTEETWLNVSDKDYERIGTYLATCGCEIEDYKVTDGVFRANVRKNGKVFLFAYNNAEGMVTVVYPKGTYDEAVDAAERNYTHAVESLRNGDFNSARSGFISVGRSFKKTSAYLNEIEDFFNTRFVKSHPPVCITSKGKIMVSENDEECNSKEMEKWKDIKSIVIGVGYALGLRSNGTVVSCGKKSSGATNVNKWKDIVMLTDGGMENDEGDHTYTIGLKKNGTVVATGYNEYGQCDVSKWNDVIAVYTNATGRQGWMYCFTVGLKKDGTVLLTGGDNQTNPYLDVSDWEGVARLVVDQDQAGDGYLIGIKYDGTLLVGENGRSKISVDGWTDIVTIAGNAKLVAITTDRRVKLTGFYYDEDQVEDWNDIVEACADAHEVFGLKSDGTVIISGGDKNDYYEARDWKGMVHLICDGLSLYGITEDGEIMIAGWRNSTRSELLKWKLWEKSELKSFGTEIVAKVEADDE